MAIHNPVTIKLITTSIIVSITTSITPSITTSITTTISCVLHKQGGGSEDAQPDQETKEEREKKKDCTVKLAIPQQ